MASSRRRCLPAGQLAEQGWLQADDPDRVALHFIRLVAPGLPPGEVATADETDRSVTAGVRAFLHGYANP